MAFSTIPTALAAPFVINTIGARATLGLSTLLTSGLFIGILFMRTWLIYLGAIIAGNIILISSYIWYMQMIIETVSFIRLEEKRFTFMDVNLPRLPGIAIYTWETEFFRHVVYCYTDRG